MKLDKIVCLYIILASMLSILFFPVILEPLDNDVFYHLIIAREMINSKTPLILHDPWFNAPEGLLHSYPPLFHWVLVLFSLGGILNMEQIAVLFQIVFYPLALLTVYRLVSYVENKETAFVAIVILTLYFPFFGRTHLAIPEALQHVLIPLTFLAYLKGREKLCGILMALMLANHIFDPLLVFFAILTHYILYRKEPFNIRDFLLITSPGLIFQAYGIYGFFGLVSMVQSASISDIALSLSSNYYRMYLALVSSSVMIILGVWFFRRKLINRSNAIFAVWFLFSLPVFFKLPNRFPAYVGLPLAALAAILIIKLRDGRKFFYDLYLPIIIALLISSTYLSYLWFPHVHDFYKPGVDVNERLALSWIEKNIPKDEIIQLNRGRTFYEGYRIAYFTDHKTTESENISRYLYSIFPDDSSENWTLLRHYDTYKIYIKSNRITMP